MTWRYKVGERVRLAFGRDEGTIIEDDGEELMPYTVQWDGGHTTSHCDRYELAPAVTTTIEGKVEIVMCDGIYIGGEFMAKHFEEGKHYRVTIQPLTCNDPECGCRK